MNSLEFQVLDERSRLYLNSYLHLLVNHAPFNRLYLSQRKITRLGTSTLLLLLASYSYRLIAIEGLVNKTRYCNQVKDRDDRVQLLTQFQQTTLGKKVFASVVPHLSATGVLILVFLAF